MSELLYPNLRVLIKEKVKKPLANHMSKLLSNLYQQRILAMFKHLFDFKKQKTKREAVEFFAFYGCIFAVLSVVIG